MKSPHKFSFNEIESPQSTERDVFDPDPVDEEDLWFLPAPDHAVLEAADLPGPRADHRSLVDVAGWGAAEAALARPLAELCTRYGALAARLQMGPAGWGQRLAMQEAVDLSWLSGDRVAADRLAQWLTLRLAGEAEDAQALARAGWAARRLQGASKPTDDLALFLGRQSEGGAPDAVADWHEVMGQAAPLHSITQAALSYHLWPVFGIAGQYGIALPMIEAAVVSAHHATMGIAGARFVPLALGGAGGLRTAGTPQERLQRWIAGAARVAKRRGRC